jgi:hypothetical protein
MSAKQKTDVFSFLGNYNKEGRPRNLGRGVSKPKKNTVASLLAQSRAVGIKPQQLIGPGADIVGQLLEYNGSCSSSFNFSRKKSVKL